MTDNTATHNLPAAAVRELYQGLKYCTRVISDSSRRTVMTTWYATAAEAKAEADRYNACNTNADQYAVAFACQARPELYA